MKLKYRTLRVQRSINNVKLPDKEYIDVVEFPFKVTPAKITLHRGKTFDRGNFIFDKLDVSVELPCYKEEIEDGTACEAVSKIVTDWLEQEIAKIDQED